MTLMDRYSNEALQLWIACSDGITYITFVTTPSSVLPKKTVPICTKSFCLPPVYTPIYLASVGIHPAERRIVLIKAY